MGKSTHFQMEKTKCRICGRKNIRFLKKHFRFYKKCETQYVENGWMDEVTEASLEHRRRNKNHQNKLRYNPQKRKQTYLQKKKSNPSSLETNTQLLINCPENSQSLTLTDTANNSNESNNQLVNLLVTNCQPSTSTQETSVITHIMEPSQNIQTPIVHEENLNDKREELILKATSKQTIIKTIRRLLNTFKKLSILHEDSQNNKIIAHFETKTIN